MNDSFRFVLNGAAVQVDGLDPHTTLLGWLRARGLSGAKESCAEGECGACAVVVVAAANGTDGSRYQTQNACLILLPEVAGAEVWTVEAVAGRDGLHPVQQALVQHGSSQCGYCTPGFVMTMFAHYYSAPRRRAAEALAGNLCRCTGYRPIRDAAEALPLPVYGDPFLARLQQAPPAAAAVAYEACGARFDRPASLDEALALRRAHPAATLLQGGTDLVVDSNLRGTRHAHVISLSAIESLRRCEERDGAFVIGAGVTWHELEERLAPRVPLLQQLISLFASPLIRARATLGGNLMTASPVGDAAPVLLALDATVECAAPGGLRRIALHDFFVGYRQTLLGDDEILAAVHVPVDQPTAARFYKVSKRELDDISSVAAALAVRLDDGVVTRARFAFGGVAATPMRALAAEDALVGRPLDATSLADCQRLVLAAFTPISDVRASEAYRSAMLGSLLAKFWHEVAP
ncbi:MAG: FAD binding domain-containing protein [Planctomycetota bacterium]|nr:FAD binding domain-containing protein [Planctomycetota bacterium]